MKGLGPGVRGGRVVAGSHHDDRRRALRLVRPDGLLRAIGPQGAQVRPLGERRTEHGGIRLRLLGQLLVLVRRAGGIVGAVDGPVRLGGVVGEGAVRFAAVVQVRNPLEHCAVVPLYHLFEGLGQSRPRGVAVEHADDPREEHRVVEGACGIRRLERGFLGGLQKRADFLAGLVDGRAEHASARIDAGFGVALEDGLEAEGLVIGVLRSGACDVDRAVEDHTADILGEELGVLAAERGAVGEAHVVEFGIADELAHDVHVARRRLRADEGQEFAGFLLAGLGERLERGLFLLGLLGVGQVEGGVEELAEVVVVIALYRGGLADPSGVEPHDVVLLPDAIAEIGVGPAGHVYSGGAGPSGVDEERPHRLLARGGHLRHRDGDRLALRLRVVEGDLDLCASQVAVLALLARFPGHLLLVEGIEALRDRRPSGGPVLIRRGRRQRAARHDESRHSHKGCAWFEESHPLKLAEASAPRTTRRRPASLRRHRPEAVRSGHNAAACSRTDGCHSVPDRPAPRGGRRGPRGEGFLTSPRSRGGANAPMAMARLA